MKKDLRVRFTDEEKIEYKSITLNGLKQGQTFTEIANHIGISNSMVSAYKRELVAKGAITEEEIEIAKAERKQREKEENPDRKKVLQGLKQGKTYRDISRGVSFSEARVSQVAKELIQEGKITQDEIDKAASENDKKAKLEMRIMQLVNEGKKYREIEEIVGYGYGTIRPIIQKLEREGKVKYKKARRNEGRELQTEIDDELIEECLKFLLIGLPPESIQKNLNIEVGIFKEVKKRLIADGKITPAIISEKRAEKKAKDKERVYVLLLRGYSHREIMSDLKYVALGYVQELIRSLKAEGRITDKQIEEAKFESNEREIREYILKGLREGYTQQEIADKDETGYLSREKVKWYKDKMVAEGLITEEEIRRAREKRETERRIEKRKSTVKEDDVRILKLFELGFPQEKIANAIGASAGYVSNRKQALFLRKEISRTRIKNLRGKLETKAEKRREEITKRFREGQDVKIDTVKDHIEYTKAKFDIGEVEEKDIDLLSEVIKITLELITPGNVNLIITYYTREGDFNQAINFVNKCIAECGNSEQMLAKLTKAAKAIKLSEKKRNAKRMLEAGEYSLEVIAAETRLSTIEVIKLKKKMEGNAVLSREGKKQVPEGYGDDGEK